MKKLIAPSILASDFARLGDEIIAVANAGADWIHVDVMDGVFVPNITIGVPVVKSIKKAIKKVTDLPLDVHLMITDPERYVEAFSDAGANIVTIHAEATPHLDRTIMQIKSMGKRAGVAVNPGTPIALIDDILEVVDMVLIMSVNPGYGGQKFIPYTLKKIKALKEILQKRELDHVLIEIDGGITAKNIHDAAEAGVDVFVAGSSVFGMDDYSIAISKLRENI